MHAMEGASVIHAGYLRGRVGLSSWLSLRGGSGSDGGIGKGNGRADIMAGLAALPVLTGLWVLSEEPAFMLSLVIRRYQVTLMEFLVN